MAQFGFEVIDLANTGIRLNQFCQVTDVADETQCKFFRGLDSAIQLDFALFIKLVELQRGFFQFPIVHI